MIRLRRFSTVALAFLLTLATALPVSAGSIINASSVIASQACTTANAIPKLTTASTSAAVFGCSSLTDDGTTVTSTLPVLIDSDTGYIAFGDTPDAYLRRAAAANLKQGTDAAAPVAQYLSVANVSAGTANTAGAARYIDGSQGTGTGAGGSIIFRTAAAGGAGSNQNALANFLTIGPTNVTLASGGLIFGTTSGLYNPSDNVLEQRNGANAQTFRVYNTFTDGSTNEYAKLTWASNTFKIATVSTPAGTARAIRFDTDDIGRWNITTAGHFTPEGAYDVGASNAFVRSGYFNASLLVNTTAASGLHADVTSSAGTPPFGGVVTGATNVMTAWVANAANANAVILGAYKTRSATGSDADAAVASGDDILDISGYAADGGAYRRVTSILSEVSTYTGSDDVSGRVSIWTRNDGAGATLTERWRVAPDGQLSAQSHQGNNSVLSVSGNAYGLSGSNASPMLDLAGTWNTSGAPTAIKLVITDTASNASSLLMDLQTAAGGSQFQVTKAGGVIAAGSLRVGNDQFVNWMQGGAVQVQSRAITDGVWQLLNNAGNGFTRLVLGTNDASGVSFVKNTTTVQVKLGDSSGFADLQPGQIVGSLSGAALVKDNAQNIGIHSGGTVTLTDDGSASDVASLGAAPFGLLVVNLGTDNDVCTFILKGAGNAVAEVSDPGNLCTTTKDNAGTINVYFDTAAYYIQNNRGGSRTARLVLNGA